MGLSRLQAVEDDVKKRSQAGEGGAAKTLCMPFDQPGFKLPALPEGDYLPSTRVCKVNHARRLSSDLRDLACSRRLQGQRLSKRILLKAPNSSKQTPQQQIVGCWHGSKISPFLSMQRAPCFGESFVVAWSLLITTTLQLDLPS
jgi:hypothetical protein